MTEPIRTIAVLGGGSAGLLAALTLEMRLPQVDIQVYRSRRLGVIGVGEATTPWLPTYLHDVLALDRGRLMRQVQPVWKLGNRLEWGPSPPGFFNYPFGGPFLERRHARLTKENSYFCLAEGGGAPSDFGCLMDLGRAPVFARPDGSFAIDHRYGYHLENRQFIEFLERLAQERGVSLHDREVSQVMRSPAGDIDQLVCRDGPPIRADFYVDCSGFRGELIGEALGVGWLSFRDSLFCDTAVVGTSPRREPIRPYTTATTMDHGWCWRIEFTDYLSRGYVYCSRFCSRDEAIAELRRLDPHLDEPISVVSFPSGRRERFWDHNVAAVGNSSGFVEPLESTGLQMIGETSITLANSLADCDARPTAALRELANRQIARWWEDIRGFLAVHFKFNSQRDTPFWRCCRAETNLAAAEPIAEFYRQCGPSGLGYTLVPKESIFGYGGYLALLIGQRAPTDYVVRLHDDERRLWREAVARIRQQAAQALPMDEALALVRHPQWNWGQEPAGT